jgi:hypothetical protein
VDASCAGRCAGFFVLSPFATNYLTIVNLCAHNKLHNELHETALQAMGA